MKKLDKSSRASYIRHRNRCSQTGKPRSYRRSVGLCRNQIRHLASFGILVGIRKAS
jgi:small subunit ribosomal protein S14